MHQSMNHFYDQQNINISIKVKPCEDAEVPNAVIIVNGNVLFDNDLNSIQNISHSIELLSDLLISIELKNKNYKQSPTTGIIIESLKIDDFDIIPNWTHLANYTNDHNNQNPTNHLGYNGVWSLNINEPFYRWVHKITGQGWLLQP